MTTNPIGDPYAEAASIDDHRTRDELQVEIEEDAIEGIHTPKLIVALRDASDDTEALAVIEEPEAGVWRLTKQ